MPLCNVCMCTLSRLFIILAYFFALLNNVAFNNIVEFAKSQIELMSEKMMKLIGEKKANPFQFKQGQGPGHSMPNMECWVCQGSAPSKSPVILTYIGQRPDSQWWRQNHSHRGEGGEDQAVRTGARAVQREGEKFLLQVSLHSGRSIG